MLTSNGKARQKAARQGSYFFLSYAHSPPLPSSWQGTDLQQADHRSQDATDNRYPCLN